MRAPRTLLALLLLTALVAVAHRLFDADPADRPLPNPYPLLLHLERNLVLRTPYHGARRAAAQAVEPVIHGFERRGSLEEVEADPALLTRWAADGLIPNTGVLAVEGLDGGSESWELWLAGPLADDLASLIVEARVRVAPIGDVPTWSVEADLAVHWSERGPGSTRLRLRPGDPDPPSLRSRALVTASAARGRWLELRLGVPVPRDAPPGARPALGLLLHTSPGVLEVDEVVVSAGTRLDGLLAGGYPAGIPTSEGTRALKRMVRRGSDERLCLVLAPDSRLDLDVEMPRPAFLDFGLSTLADDGAVGATELTVAVSRLGSFEETVRRFRLDGEDAGRFRDERVDLSRYAGERVRLRLRVTAPLLEDAPLVLLADPTLLGPRPERQPPHVFLLTLPPGTPAPRAARLAAEATLERWPVAAPTPLARHNVFSVLSGTVPSDELPPAPDAIPTRPARLRSLPDLFTRSGYLSFASARAPHGEWLLEGFRRRWAATRGDPMRACLAWFDRYREHPCLLFARLEPETAESSVIELLRFLRATELLDESIVLVMPEVEAGDGSAGLVHLPGERTVSLRDGSPLALPALRGRLLGWAGLESSHELQQWEWHKGTLPARVSALWHEGEDLR